MQAGFVSTFARVNELVANHALTLTEIRIVEARTNNL